MAMTAPETIEEQQARTFLRDVTKLLSKALDSLGGKDISGKPRYVAWCALTICKAADGYLCLRDAGKKDAARLLVRLPLELMFKVMAVFKEPGFLFRLTFTEWQQEKKLLASPPDAASEARTIAEMQAVFRSALPGEPAVCKKARVADAAKAAGLVSRYQGDYAAYCNHTHGAMRAMMGQLNDATDSHDTRIMALSVLMILEQLKAQSTADIPELEPLVKRYGELPRT